MHIIYCVFLLGILHSSVFAGAHIQAELIDGSVINGEIVSFRDGVYTLKSDVLGTIEIKESTIQLIRVKSFGKPARSVTAREPISRSNTPRDEELQNLKNSMMSDNEIMEQIISLKNDPDVQELLRDPNIMNAINSGDIGTLMSSPKFMKILENPAIQQIQKEVNE
jgi:hypothetical protein